MHKKNKSENISKIGNSYSTEVTMKRIILIWFFFIFVSANLAIAQQPDLSFSAVFDKPEYRVEEPVKLTVAIKNNSSTGVFVRWTVTSVKVEADGKPVFKLKGTPGSRGETEKLKPGSFLSKEFEYSSERFEMPSPGSYQIEIAYKNEEELSWSGGSGIAKGGKTKHELWMGELKASATLRIIK